MPKVNFPYTVGVDWLQLYVKFHTNLPERGRQGNITFAAHDFPTPQFLRKIEVYWNDGQATQKFCEVLCVPRLTALPKSAGMLKVENKWLYTSVWFAALSEVMHVLDMEFCSISRIDLYWDCIRYQNGLYPKKLIADYISRKVLKIGINRGYIAFNDWGYNIPISDNNKAISVQKTLPNINGITWGQKGYIQTQIYNKSLEMRSVKYKEWIARAWEDAGLRGADVWRTEIRVQKSGKDMLLIESGDLFALGMNEIADEYRVLETFLAYAQKHVRFVKADYHAKKQQMQPIDLFCARFDKLRVKPKHASRSTGTNRVLRMVVNYLTATAATIAEVAPNARERSYATRLSDAATTLEHLFEHYEFGEPTSKFSPEMKWLSARLLAERWQQEAEQVKRAAKKPKLEILSPQRNLFNAAAVSVMHAKNAPTPAPQGLSTSAARPAQDLRKTRAI